MNKHLVALTLCFALVITAAANAQTIKLKVNVPFNFIAGGVTLPAGEYTVKTVDDGARVLSFSNSNSHAANLVISNTCVSVKPSQGTKLVFHRYGSRYMLSEIWVNGDSSGHQIPPGPREAEYAKDFPKNEVVLVAVKR